MRKQAENMRNLMTSAGQDGVILGNVCMDGRRIVSNTVDEMVVFLQRCSRNLPDLSGHGSREHERLPLGSRKQELCDSVDVIPEAHIQQSVSFVQD